MNMGGKCDKCGCQKNVVSLIQLGDGTMEKWCSWCFIDPNSGSFFCDISGYWYTSKDYTQVYVDGDKVCLEEWKDNLYLWPSDNKYHWRPEPETLGEYITEQRRQRVALPIHTVTAKERLAVALRED
jgi:hypothetical protein